MSLSDMKAIYDWGKNLPDSSIIRVALTAPSPVSEGNLLDSVDCGMGPRVSQLCPYDPTYNMIKKYVASVFIDPKVLGEKAPIQFANGANNFPGLDSSVVSMFDPTGLQLLDTVGHQPVAQTQILDYSGGHYPQTTAWLQAFFGGTVIAATPTNPAPARGQQTTGIVVVLGHDFALRFLGH
jgi:hypothetical protein